jgi:hypothetical protein
VEFFVFVLPPAQRKLLRALEIFSRIPLGASRPEHWKIEREERIDLMRTVFLAGLSQRPPQFWILADIFLMISSQAEDP